MQARAILPIMQPIGFRLREGLFTCRCTQGRVFLDLMADRYFILSRDAEEAFDLLLRGEVPSSQLDAAVKRLRSIDLIAPDDAAIGLAPSVELDSPQADLLAGRLCRPRLRSVGAVIVAQAEAALSLRTLTLDEILSRLARDRRHGPEPCEISAIELAAAFDASGLIIRARDRCLIRAIALFAMARRRGLREAALVFGVRLAPFAAHAWVQQGRDVLVGSFEQARLYTPILVVR